MKQKILLFLISGCALVMNPDVASAVYTTGYEVLRIADPVTAFSSPDNAEQNDGLVATSTASTYSIVLRGANITSWGLPSDALIVGFRWKIYGDVGVNSNAIITPYSNSTACNTQNYTLTATGAIHIINGTNNYTRSLISPYNNSCSNTGFSHPTMSNLSTVGIKIYNYTAYPNPLTIDYAELALDYLSTSLDSGTGINNSGWGEEVCGNDFLSLDDLFCNTKNFTANVFGFFFAVDTEVAENDINDVIDTINTKVPFAYINAVNNINWTTATLASELDFDFPVKNASGAGINYIHFEDESGILTVMSNILKPIFTVLIWLTAILYFVHLPKRFL